MSFGLSIGMSGYGRCFKASCTCLLKILCPSLLLSNFSILISLCSKELPVIYNFLSMQIYNVLLYYYCEHICMSDTTENLQNVEKKKCRATMTCICLNCVDLIYRVEWLPYLVGKVSSMCTHLSYNRKCSPSFACCLLCHILPSVV